MRVLPWLIGLVMPACAGQGIEGLPVPPPMDVAHIERPSSPNTALAAPAGFTPKPDIVTATYPVPARRLYAAMRDVALREPRTFLQAEYADRLQFHVVVRSAWMNFPDLVVTQVTATAPGASALVIYARSVYGESDLGVNRARVTAWIAALDRVVPPSR